MNILEIVKDQTARFVYYRDRALCYQTDNGFLFPVPVDDAGSATFSKDEKALILMRYIRKHLNETEAARADQEAVCR